MAINEKRRISIASALLATYLIVRFAFTQFVDSLGSYASYYFEVLLVISSLYLFWPNAQNFWQVKKSQIPLILAALPAGFVIFKGAGYLQISVPFDLSGTETILFLLVVAPILEELIFRFFVWQPIYHMSKTAALIATSLLFSYSHFHSIWFVPQEIHNFIFYQTAYTLLLGLACGYAVWRHNSLIGAMLVHFGFNLGFYLGSIF